jgi:NitT/TauT family transport system ATP-binding protein/nitrate/nitrite transport system substrate-binding protein
LFNRSEQSPLTQISAPSAEKYKVHGSAAPLRLGYMPLTDAAPLLVAAQQGLFIRHGVEVVLSPLTAWAAIRDRVAYGSLDGGQMLLPMPIATTLGLGGVQEDFSVVATLNRNGNTIVLSEALFADILAADPAGAVPRPMAASALAAGLARRRGRSGRAPVFAVVFGFSSHNYLLREWLASGGIVPERDVKLVVLPPPLVAGQLAEGKIDGFCAGEPWGSRAVDLQAGRIVLTSADIRRNHPEKVLAFPTRVVAADPDRIVAVIAALMEAGRWLDAPENRAEAVALLCAEALVDIPPEMVARMLAGRLVMAPDEAAVPVDPLRFFANDATFPEAADGRWWLAQMRRWQHVPPQTNDAVIERIWRTDLWRRAASS